MTADLLLLNAFALAIGLAASGKRIRSERTASGDLPFSDAVWHGNTLYLCGHIGLIQRLDGHPLWPMKKHGW
jgi:enamine deaminase RidA (YjgF/YER057c/UK114 family)